MTTQALLEGILTTFHCQFTRIFQSEQKKWHLGNDELMVVVNINSFFKHTNTLSFSAEVVGLFLLL